MRVRLIKKTKLSFLLILGLLSTPYFLLAEGEQIERNQGEVDFQDSVTSPLMMSGRGGPKNSAEQGGYKQNSRINPDTRSRTTPTDDSSSAFSRGTVVSERDDEGPQNELTTIQDDIRSFIETTATITVAGDLLQRREEIKNSLREKNVDIDWDSEEKLDSFIEEALLNKYKLGIAVELRQRNVSSSSGLAEDQRIAEDPHQAEIQRVKRREEMAAREALILEIQRKKTSLAAKLKEVAALEGTTFFFNPVRTFRMNNFDPESLLSSDEINGLEVTKDCQKLYQATIKDAKCAYEHALKKFKESEQEAMSDRGLELVLLGKKTANKMEESGDCCQQGAEAFKWGDCLTAASFMSREYFVHPHEPLGGAAGCSMHIAMCLEGRSKLLEKKIIYFGHGTDTYQLTSFSQPIESLLIEAIVSNDEAMQSFELAVKAYRAGDIKKGDCLGGNIVTTAGVGSSLMHASYAFQKSAFLLEKSEHATGDSSGAWKEASETAKSSASLYLQAAEASKIENISRADYLAGIGFGTSNGAAGAMERAADHLKSRAIYLEQGREQEAAAEFQQAQRQLQRAEAYKRGDRATGDSLKDEGECVIS